MEQANQTWNHWARGTSTSFDQFGVGADVTTPKKRHIPGKLSSSEVWKPVRRPISSEQFSKYPSQQNRPQGIRPIDFKPTVPQEKLHVKKYLVSPQTQEFQFRAPYRTVQRNGTVLNPNTATTKEFGLNESLGRKRKSIDTGHKRNGIGIYHQGDKPYGSPEKSTGFYKTPGLIPGSTVRRWPINHSRTGSVGSGTKMVVPGKLDMGSKQDANKSIL